MLTSILVPVDGSALAARAIPFAVQLARSSKARVVLLRAHLPNGDSLSLRLHHPDHSPAERADIERGAAEAELIATATELREAGLEVEPKFVECPPAEAILETAAATHAGLIVMSTHGYGGLGRMLYGSVADAVLKHASIPLLMVPAHVTQIWSTDQPPRMLVALDGSAVSREILGPATVLSSVLKSEIFLLMVVEPLFIGSQYGDTLVPPDLEVEWVKAERYLAGLAARLQSSVPQAVGVRVAYGKAATTISDVACEVNSSLIAMATHGRGGVARFLVGSVATATLQQSRVPVLLFRPTGVPEDSSEYLTLSHSQ